MKILGIDTANSTPLGQKNVQGAPRHPMNSCYYNSTLLSEKKSLVGRSIQVLLDIPCKLWSGIKWVFETVFFCFDFGPQIPGKTNAERLKNEKMKFVELRTEFITNKSSKTYDRTSFKKWWGGVFNGLPQIMKEKIVKESMRDNAVAKGLTGSAQEDYIAIAYQNVELCDKALRYVRDLEMESIGSRAWDPIDDSQVPKFLKDIAESLQVVLDRA